jgi:glycosyltransferase involved in cell wall biosynthesis
MKKVLFVIDHSGGGNSKSFFERIYEKRDKFKTIIPYFFSLRKTKFDYISSKQLKISKTKNKFNITSFFELKNFIKKEKIDILHPMLLKSMLYCIILKIFYFPKIKLIFHEHGEIFSNKIWYNKFLKYSSNKVNIFLPVSKATKDKLILNSNLNPKKMRVLYNFIELEKFKSSKYDSNKARKKLKLKKKDFVLGFCGRLVPLKNIDKLILAGQLIKDQIPNLKILIIGNGPERKKLEKLSKKIKMEENIKFLGFRRDVAEIISTFDLGILISDYENLSLFLLELVAMNKQIIATNVGGNPEIITKDIGILINSTSQELILSAIMDLKERKINLKEFNKIKKKFTLELFISKLEKIFKNL